jgi:hypothetical protein
MNDNQMKIKINSLSYAGNVINHTKPKHYYSVNHHEHKPPILVYYFDYIHYAHVQKKLLIL